MRSRFVIGIGAWLLGAVAATAGSLLAVEQLAQGLLEQHTKQVSVAMVNRELEQENAERPTPAAAATPSRQPTSPAAHRTHAPRPARTHSPAAQVNRDAGRLLTSTGGSVAATCTSGGAYLLYESPAQGYDRSSIQRGPSQVAKVTFTNSTGGVVMRVTCDSAGVPSSRTSAFRWNGHDE